MKKIDLKMSLTDRILKMDFERKVLIRNKRLARKVLETKVLETKVLKTTVKRTVALKIPSRYALEHQ